MGEIDIEELFKIYKDKFGVTDINDEGLRKEFDSMMLKKYEFMPFWFVVKLIELRYDVNDQEEYF